jgi:hypothetical protein
MSKAAVVILVMDMKWRVQREAKEQISSDRQSAQPAEHPIA